MLGQRDVHGGDVEDHHQLGDQQHEQQQTALLALGRVGAGGAVSVAEAVSRLRCCSGGPSSVCSMVLLLKSDIVV